MTSNLTIKFHGTTTVIPTEILLKSTCGFIATTGDHLVLDKIIYLGNETAIVLKKNGVVVPGHHLISLNTIRNLDYQACTLQQYYKLRAFL